MNKKLLLILIIFFSYGNLSAQRLQDDLNALNQQMKSARQYYRMEYLIQDANNPNTPLEASSIECYNWFPFTVFKYPQVEFYHNDRFKLALYKHKKRMVINKSDKKIDKEMMKLHLSVDSLLRFYNKVELRREEGDKRVYRIYYKQRLVRHQYADIEYNFKLKQLNKITLYYNQSIKELFGTTLYGEKTQKVIPRVQIIFSSYRNLSKSEWHYFMATDVLSLDKKGNAHLMPSYKNFEVVNFFNVKLK